MTDRDVLDEAVAALRDQTKASHEPKGCTDEMLATSTRRKLLARAMTRRRRFTIVRLVLPFAALLGVGAAWAARTDRLPRWFAGNSDVVRSPAAPAAAAPPIVPAPGVAPSAPPPDSSAAPSATPPASSASASPVAPVAHPVAPDEALYRAAHEAHFVAHDWPRALGAWDAYLSQAPKGRFVPEARYNRALVLIRLGRRDEARQALLPFADGAFGGYRQVEARELLDALE